MEKNHDEHTEKNLSEHKEDAPQAPEDFPDITRADIVRLSGGLLESVIRSADALKDQPLTPERINQLKMVHAFLGAHNKAIRTKMEFFRMRDTQEKYDAIREHSRAFLEEKK